MKNYLMKRYQCFCLLIAGVFTLFFILCIFVTEKAGQKYIDYTKARLLTAKMVNDAKMANLLDADYPYALIDSSGSVLYSTTSYYKEQSNIDIQILSSLSADRQLDANQNIEYIVPIEQSNHFSFFLVVILPKESVSNNKSYIQVVMITVLLFLAGILLVFFLYRFQKNDMINPIRQIYRSTAEISKGNYDQKITYDYDGELGALCHNIELMRDELDVSTQMQKKLYQNEKLLLAYISHDLKTPLASIMGYIEGIRAGIAKDKQTINKYSDIIIKKIHMLSKLIDDVLEHSKHELNEFSIEMEDVYAASFFLPCFRELEVNIGKAGLSFYMNEIPNVLIRIDRRRITQVIENIIGNSMKYSKSPGNISVLFKVTDVYFTLEITDTGSGIAIEDIPFIFEKFYRGEKARTLNIPGSGLGLAIAKYIITKHGGNIECDSLLDQGTTIFLALPLAK